MKVVYATSVVLLGAALSGCTAIVQQQAQEQKTRGLSLSRKLR